MTNEEMLRVIRRHTLDTIFQVMRVAVNHRKGPKELNIIVLYLKSTLARAPIYDGAYPEKLWTAPPGNSVGVTKHSLSLIVQLEKKSLEESTSLNGTYFLTTFGNKSTKVGSESKIESKLPTVHIA